MKPGIVSISVTILNIRIFPGKKMCIHFIVTTAYDGFFMYNLGEKTIQGIPYGYDGFFNV